MAKESANIFRLLDNVMSTKYGVTYLNDKSFKTLSCRDLAKFKNKISILISLTFGLRMESKEMPTQTPTYASSRSKGWIFQRGKGGDHMMQHSQYLSHSHVDPYIHTYITTILTRILVQLHYIANIFEEKKKLRSLKLEKIYTQTKETKISKKQHIFQQSKLSSDDFCKKIGYKRAETSSFSNGEFQDFSVYFGLSNC